MEQLKEFKETLDKFAAGNVTLVDEISSMQLVMYCLLLCKLLRLQFQSSSVVDEK